MDLLKPLKSAVRFNTTSDGVKLVSFKIPENKAGELNLQIRKENEDYSYRYYIELKNKFNKLLGYEHYSYFKDSENITGLYIKVEPEYRQRNYYFGEIIRLASIIEMLENKVKNFIITSKETAINFHSKYKFRPAVTSFDSRDKLLQNIAADKGREFYDLSQKALELIEKIKNHKLYGLHIRDLNDEINNLFYNYIQRAQTVKNPQQHQLKWVLDMKLTEEEIRKNKDFFNNLFNKHGIDYRI